MEWARYIGEENLSKLCENAVNIDISKFQTFASSLDYKVGTECRKEAKKSPDKSVTNSLIRHVLNVWYEVCQNQVQKMGFSLLCEKLKSSGLETLVEDFVDPSKPRKKEVLSPVRLGLNVANTYKGVKDINETPGCEKSSAKIREVMEHWDFKITSCLNRTRNEVLDEDIPTFLEEVKRLDCDDIFFYFSGHGGYVPFVSDSGGEVKNGINFCGTEGSITEGGEFFVGHGKENIFKYEIVKKILEVAKASTRKIFIFDCCRGNNNTEMSQFKLNVKQNGLHQLKNSDFKNTYIFNTTLPYQVAFVNDVTFFAREWCKLVKVDDPQDMSKLDELINAELKKSPATGFEQAVQLDKIGITDPFYWFPSTNTNNLAKASDNIKTKEEEQEEAQSPKKRAKRCVIMGDGTTMSMDEFYEENDWIDTDEPGAFQNEVDEVYEGFDEKPINFLSTFQPKDPEMRKFFSFQTRDGKELVSRTQACVSNFKYNEKYHKEKDSIPECSICGCVYLMPNVYMCVYEHNDDDKMTVRMKYGESMEQACFYHFLGKGVDKGRKPWGQKRKR